jgi:hypothetical protein
MAVSTPPHRKVAVGSAPRPERPGARASPPRSYSLFATETALQSPQTTLMTLCLVPTVPVSANNQAPECHVLATSANFTDTQCRFASAPRKVAGAPRRRSSHGEGVGVISFGGEEKTLSSDCVAAPARAIPRPKIELLNWLSSTCGLERLVDIPSLTSNSLGNRLSRLAFFSNDCWRRLGWT